jgi:protein phosphatase
LIPGDKVLLCSDGLTDLVADPEILEILDSEGDLKGQLAKLVDLANLRGGYDNITAILLQAPGEDLFDEDEDEDQEGYDEGELE